MTVWVHDLRTVWVHDLPWTAWTGIEHRDGVPWHNAPLPRRWHRCRPQTRGWANGLTLYERCPCGGLRRNGEAWMRRNSERALPRAGKVVKAVTGG